jgi:hypothetical protein
VLAHDDQRRAANLVEAIADLGAVFVGLEHLEVVAGVVAEVLLPQRLDGMGRAGRG